MKVHDEAALSFVIATEVIEEEIPVLGPSGAIPPGLIPPGAVPEGVLPPGVVGGE